MCHICFGISRLSWDLFMFEQIISFFFFLHFLKRKEFLIIFFSLCIFFLFTKYIPSSLISSTAICSMIRRLLVETALATSTASQFFFSYVAPSMALISTTFFPISLPLVSGVWEKRCTGIKNLRFSGVRRHRLRQASDNVLEGSKLITNGFIQPRIRKRRGESGGNKVLLQS